MRLWADVEGAETARWAPGAEAQEAPPRRAQKELPAIDIGGDGS